MCVCRLCVCERVASNFLHAMASSVSRRGGSASDFLVCARAARGGQSASAELIVLAQVQATDRMFPAARGPQADIDRGRVAAPRACTHARATESAALSARTRVPGLEIRKVGRKIVSQKIYHDPAPLRCICRRAPAARESIGCIYFAPAYARRGGAPPTVWTRPAPLPLSRPR